MRRPSRFYSWRDVRWYLLIMAFVSTVLVLRNLWANSAALGQADFWSQFWSLDVFAEISMMTILAITVLSLFKLFQSE